MSRFGIRKQQRAHSEGLFLSPGNWRSPRAVVSGMATDKAKFTVCGIPKHALSPGESPHDDGLGAMTSSIRPSTASTTATAVSFGGQQVIFLNGDDMKEMEASPKQQWLDITSHFEGQTRVAPPLPGDRILAIARKSAAETSSRRRTSSMPVGSVAVGSNQPAHRRPFGSRSPPPERSGRSWRGRARPARA